MKQVNSFDIYFHWDQKFVLQKDASRRRLALLVIVKLECLCAHRAWIGIPIQVLCLTFIARLVFVFESWPRGLLHFFLLLWSKRLIDSDLLIFALFDFSFFLLNFVSEDCVFSLSSSLCGASWPIL